MRDAGITHFKWNHSGGSVKPRCYHRDELNGKVFDLNKILTLILFNKNSESKLSLPIQKGLNFQSCTSKPFITRVL